MQQLDYNDGNRVFLRGPCRDVISKGKHQLIVQICIGGCEERIWECEAEEYPLLEAVAREQLVKTQHAGKGIEGAVVIHELLRLALEL
jgi:hypothetical protein